MSTDSSPVSPLGSETSLVSQSLREARWILLIWLVSSVWTVSYCWVYGYQPMDPASVSTVFGMPRWVFWGVAAPWLITTAVSIVFAIWGIREDDLSKSSSGSTLLQQSAVGDLGESEIESRPLGSVDDFGKAIADPQLDHTERSGGGQ